MTLSSSSPGPRRRCGDRWRLTLTRGSPRCVTAAALQPEHLDWLRDLIAIHYAWSIQYYAVFEDSLLNARQEACRFWQQYPAVLDAVAASRLGLPGGDVGSRGSVWGAKRCRLPLTCSSWAL